MKKIIKKIALVSSAASLLLASSAFAAELKIGVVNYQEVMAKMPQRVAVLQKLDTEFTADKEKLVQLEKDIKYFQEKLKRDGSLMAPKEKTELEQKIGAQFQQYQAGLQAFQQKSAARQNEEMNKLVGLVQQTVDNIAAKGNYDLVLQKQSAVFSKPEFDITNVVVEQVSKIK